MLASRMTAEQTPIRANMYFLYLGLRVLSKLLDHQYGGLALVYDKV